MEPPGWQAKPSAPPGDPFDPTLVPPLTCTADCSTPSTSCLVLSTPGIPAPTAAATSATAPIASSTAPSAYASGSPLLAALRASDDDPTLSSLPLIVPKPTLARAPSGGLPANPPAPPSPAAPAAAAPRERGDAPQPQPGRACTCVRAALRRCRKDTRRGAALLGQLSVTAFRSTTRRYTACSTAQYNMTISSCSISSAKVPVEPVASGLHALSSDGP